MIFETQIPMLLLIDGVTDAEFMVAVDYRFFPATRTADEPDDPQNEWGEPEHVEIERIRIAQMRLPRPSVPGEFHDLAAGVIDLLFPPRVRESLAALVLERHLDGET